jgi:hypothetical protein
MSNIVPYVELEKMAAAVAKSGLFGVKSTEQAIAIMLVAQAEGRHPALAARDYDVIQGRPAKKAEAMMRDFLESGGKVEWHKLDDDAAIATFSHPSGGSVKIDWTMKRATAAGLGGRDMWKKYPRQMLRSRTVSEGIRTVCPMATSGMYVPEEVSDIVREKNITPNAGAGDELTAEAQDKVKQVVDKAMAWINEGSIGDAYAEIENAEFDVEEKRYCWTFFDSKQRSALKKEGQRIREKYAESKVVAEVTGTVVQTISDAQKRRLEAMIGELGLKRDVVKALVKEKFGHEHFADLTPGEYSLLEIELQGMGMPL